MIDPEKWSMNSLKKWLRQVILQLTCLKLREISIMNLRNWDMTYWNVYRTPWRPSNIELSRRQLREPLGRVTDQKLNWTISAESLPSRSKLYFVNILSDMIPRIWVYRDSLCKGNTVCLFLEQVSSLWSSLSSAEFPYDIMGSPIIEGSNDILYQPQ